MASVKGAMKIWSKLATKVKNWWESRGAVKPEPPEPTLRKPIFKTPGYETGDMSTAGTDTTLQTGREIVYRPQSRYDVTTTEELTRVVRETPEPIVEKPLKPLFNEELIKYDRMDKAAVFKQGVKNTAISQQAENDLVDKISKMDKDKLFRLYEENTSLFDWYFSYEDNPESYGYSAEGNRSPFEIVVDKYEARYGDIE